jgi:hypothetical protein
MSQLFFRAVKTLSLDTISRMSNAEVEAIFCRLRWAESDGQPTCVDGGQLLQADVERNIEL